MPQPTFGATASAVGYSSNPGRAAALPSRASSYGSCNMQPVWHSAVIASDQAEFVSRLVTDEIQNVWKARLYTVQA